MKLKISMLSAIAVLMSMGGTVSAQGIVETVQEGCAAEITAYCSQVSPGEGRLLACFYAHEDKLSGQCQYALYSASAQLDQAVGALDYLATQCRDDILKFCAQVQVGEGRVLECIKSNQASVSAACNQAVADVTE
jgi:Cysteine rich repeat